MDRVNYLFYQLFLKIKYEKRRYFLYVLSFYVGLLLPTCCIANTRSVEQVIYYTTFKGMEDSFQVDWLSRTFNTIKLDKEISYSISAFYEESFPEWENQYVSIKGIDESYFYPLPKIEGRTFSKKELQEGKDVCLMNKQYARMQACEIGDMIQIRDKRLKVIGLIDNSVYSGMIIPYQTMLNVYKEEKDIQFSGTFFCENELQKQKRIDEVIEQIKEKDEFLRCMGMKQKQRRKTIRFETQMLSDIALFATVMMGIVYVLSYEWRCASKDAGSLDVTFWMYWILIVGIYLLADRLVQWLFAQYVIKRVEKGND